MLRQNSEIFKVSEQEAQELQSFCDRLGITKSFFIRSAVFDLIDFALETGEIKVGNNVYHFNKDGTITKSFPQD
jgi:hypothetical protein